MSRSINLRLGRLEARSVSAAKPQTALVIVARDQGEAACQLADLRANGRATGRVPLIVLTGVPRADE
jgi:hypothetical protein